ncbi:MULTISPECIES: PepSY-like domain-containing protein [Chitinophagaceae]
MFKKVCTVLFALSFFLIGQTQAQFRKIPSVVTNAFNKKYPEAKDVSWKDKITSFQATFTQDDIETAAWFSSDGSWKQTEVTVPIKEIPSLIRDKIQKSKYANWDIKDAVRVQKPDNGVQYRISLSGESILDKRVLIYSEDGELLKSAMSL